MEDCIFCQIVAAKLPCAKLLETDDILAFLDISPVEPGHALVIPKIHVAQIMDLPDALLAPLMFSARTIACRLRERLACDGITLSQANGACAGQVVPHVHLHVIPRYTGKPMHFHNGRYPSTAAMQAMAATLALP